MSSSMVSILRKSIVKPSSPTPISLRTHSLSYIDQALSHMYIPFAFFFPKPQQQTITNNISQAIQTSLSKTLTAYYPYAGFLRDNASVDCNDTGVEFIDARIHCPMSDVLNDIENSQTIVFPNELPWRNSYEKLAVAQVSRFECGGIAISASLCHKIGDGFTASKFINDWAATTRDSNVKPYAHFVRDSVIPPPENSPPLPTPVILAQTQHCRQKRFFFSASKINSLKAMVAAKTGIQNPTRTEVVSAYLYKCIVKTREDSNTLRPSQLFQYADIRPLALPQRLAPTSAGNLLSTFCISTTHDDDLDVARLVADLRNRKQVLYGEDMIKENELALEIYESTKGGQKPYEGDGFDKYFFSSICNLPMYDVDFGWGRPMHVSVPMGPFKNFILLFGNKSMGGVDAWVTMEEDHMAALEQNEELLQEFTST
ncbi:acylsugar acyltransferase 3-like [Ipomoea triloba]|uniref:acylsugar acyltransferase 3-like n=1 Tax=Ipomoea triloba TaxID=35885 RepID=UPI00125D0378|nr:acylsugar acyltransferase 3-like [Ipomoea triloba]